MIGQAKSLGLSVGDEEDTLQTQAKSRTNIMYYYY